VVSRRDRKLLKMDRVSVNEMEIARKLGRTVLQIIWTSPAIFDARLMTFKS
jgi:hypothetical protein